MHTVGISGLQVQRLQSVMNTAARMIYLTLGFSHIFSFLHQLHRSKAREWIDYSHSCVQVPAWDWYSLSSWWTQSFIWFWEDFIDFGRFHSASMPNLIVRRTRLSTYGNRSFPVAGPRLWNNLPPQVKSVSSIRSFPQLFSLIVVLVIYCRDHCLEELDHNFTWLQLVEHFQLDHPPVFHMDFTYSWKWHLVQYHLVIKLKLPVVHLPVCMFTIRSNDIDCYVFC